MPKAMFQVNWFARLINRIRNLANQGGWPSRPRRRRRGLDSHIPAMTEVMESRRLLTEYVAAAPDPNYWTHHDGGVYTSAGDGVLLNDSGWTDSEGGSGSTLTATLESGPSNGSVTLNPDGSFSYTPNPGFPGFGNSAGEDTFTYRASYGSAISDPVTVTILVTNASPSLNTNATNYMIPHDQPLIVTSPPIIPTDSDDYGGLTPIVSNVSHGALVFNPDGTFTYTPNQGYFGEDSFTVKYSDPLGATSETAVITIYVMNQPPTLGLPSVIEFDDTVQDTDVIYIVTASDVDDPNTNLTYGLTDPSGIFTIHPTTGVISVANASLICGDDDVEYPVTVTVSDGVNSAEETPKVKPRNSGFKITNPKTGDTNDTVTETEVRCNQPTNSTTGVQLEVIDPDGVKKTFSPDFKNGQTIKFKIGKQPKVGEWKLKLLRLSNGAELDVVTFNVQ